MVSDRCKRLLGALSDYIDGEAEASVCAEIEQHLAECDNCRVVVDTLSKTVYLYQHLEPAPLPAAVRVRLLKRLNLEKYI